MKLLDYDYDLPRKFIASTPQEDRAGARLLYVPQKEGAFSHHTFRDLRHFLKAGDVLVLNDTRVLPARLFGQKENGGKIEALLVKQRSDLHWDALVRPSGRVKKDTLIHFGENGLRLQAKVLDAPRVGTGLRQLEFERGAFLEKLATIGHMPIPPYLKRPDTAQDREFYQTVFAAKSGAIAAPTAGLHFDQSLLNTLKQQGVEIVFVTLHTSFGTFRPVAEEDLTKRRLLEEWYEIPEAAALCVNGALREGRRVIACGTTSVRALESALDSQGKLKPGQGLTQLFIYPPFSFRITQGLITNFHLPKSSLLLLAAAFLGDRVRLLDAYHEAMRQDYRFYSYGDAMLVL